MVQSRTTHTIGFMGMVVLVIGLSGSALAKSGPPGNNPGQPFAEILAQIGILNDKIDALQGPGATGPCDIPPVWGKKIAGADRFVAVLDGAAYCDQETGLVWEQSPAPIQASWQSAISHCATLEVDDRKGWSLPIREQLATLVDTQSALCAGGAPCLPDGHPFSDVIPDLYWSASTNVGDPSSASTVLFSSGFVGFIPKVDSNPLAWCVRGGQSFDGIEHDALN